jgi:hypothetical protein
MDRRPALTGEGIAPYAYDVDSVTGCWLWHRRRFTAGYPTANYRGKPVAAARHAYERTIGPIPSGHVLSPTCENGEDCVNPLHRALVSRSELLRTRASHRLGREEVAAMRRLASERTRAELATDFGVSVTTVDDVLAGRHWAGPGPKVTAQREPRISPIQRRWAGRLPSERPARIGERRWRALVHFVDGRSSAEVAAILGLNSASHARIFVSQASRRLEAALLADEGTKEGGCGRR